MLPEYTIKEYMWPVNAEIYMGLHVSATNYKRKLYKPRIYIYIYIYMGRDSAVGIATHYGAGRSED